MSPLDEYWLFRTLFVLFAQHLALQGLSLPTLFAAQVALKAWIEILPSAPQGLPPRLGIPFTTEEATIPCDFTPELVHRHADRVEIA